MPMERAESVMGEEEAIDVNHVCFAISQGFMANGLDSDVAPNPQWQFSSIFSIA